MAIAKADVATDTDRQGVDLDARPTKLDIRQLTAWYGETTALSEIDLNIPSSAITALIGPSGCGKSTLLRCLNRMHEFVDNAASEGEVRLDDKNIYDADVDPVLLRRRIGMVFQEPNPFPTMSVRENVLAGLKLTDALDPADDPDRIVERSLRAAALWDEVADQLDAPGTDLSGGQQQRLCIARAIAVDPDILLMDEPSSALDPVATSRIEDLLDELREEYTIVVVTHSMQQARRVSDKVAFLLLGDLVEAGPTARVFETPSDSRTADYIAGKFG